MNDHDSAEYGSHVATGYEIYGEAFDTSASRVWLSSRRAGS
jgi:hypothetical protein